MTIDQNDPLYPLWEQRFSEEGFAYGTEANAFLRQCATHLASNSHVLCIAEGEGRNAVYLAECGHQVTTWDYSEAAIRKQHQLAAAKQVRLTATEQVDLRHAPWMKNTWDAVVCVFGHFEQETRLATLRSMAASVRVGGWVMVEVYSKQQLSFGTGGPKPFDWLYDLTDFTTIFEMNQWRVVHLFTGEVWREEGNLHRGWSHVIQMAVQKRSS